MRKYKLIKKYPFSLPLGTELKLSFPKEDPTFSVQPYLGIMSQQYQESDLKKFPEFWQEVVEKPLEYEILSFMCCAPDGSHKQEQEFKLQPNKFYQWKSLWYTLNSLLNLPIGKAGGYIIWSIKRLSDGEIFTIGDRLQRAERVLDITKIEVHAKDINDHRIMPWFTLTGGEAGAMKIQTKAKKPLFTTEDGVEMYENDSYYSVSLTSHYVGSFKATSRTVDYTGTKQFSTEWAAKNYIEENKPCLSYNDIMSFINVKMISKELREFVREKLKA